MVSGSTIGIPLTSTWGLSTTTSYSRSSYSQCCLETQMPVSWVSWRAPVAVRNQFGPQSMSLELSR